MKATLSFALLLTVTVNQAHSAEPTQATRQAIQLDAAGPSDARHTFDGGTSVLTPAGWTTRIRNGALIISAPEGDSHVAVLETTAASADAAVAAGWAAYDAGVHWPLKQSSDRPARNGWAQVRVYQYEAADKQPRTVFARALRHGERWTVVIGDLSTPVFQKRESQLTRIIGGVWPKGYAPESFAGKTAHTLDAARLRTLMQFVDDARRAFDVPGVGLGIVQNGKVVFAGGLGVRALGKPDPVEADTLFLAASVTKPLTTLMLAKQVDAGRFGWDTPVTDVMPGFRIGDADLTRRLQMKHLLCACTGMPQQDMESIFASEGATAATAMARLSTMRPTAGFGELYQYSNTVAAAGGYVGGYAWQPKRELGAAYDAAMQKLVFDPLGMSATTFDYKRAMGRNYAAPHGNDVDGLTVPASMDFNYTGIHMRPDGGAWSSVSDLLKYVRMELAQGRLPDGRRYISPAPLLARREGQVARGGEGQSYGMGLKIDVNKGTPLIWHGGSMAGYQTEVWWLPEHDVGVVLLTNADAGVHLRGLLQRRMMELLFDAASEAETALATSSRNFRESAAAERKTLTLPAEPKLVDGLASRYSNPELGDIVIVRKDAATSFDFGAWKSEIATSRDEDGHIVFVTTSPSVSGYRFIAGEHEGRRTLVLKDDPREYVFAEAR